MNQSIQLSVIKGAMQALADGAATGSLENLEILPQHIRLVTGRTSWKSNERTIVARTLDALMFGTMELVGLPRFEVPAEYVAAVISMFVHPSNLQIACRWMETGRQTAEALGNPTSASINTEPVDARQLFSLCLQMHNDGQIAQCLSQFEERTAIKLQRTEEKTHETTSKPKQKNNF